MDVTGGGGHYPDICLEELGKISEARMVWSGFQERHSRTLTCKLSGFHSGYRYDYVYRVVYSAFFKTFRKGNSA